jgi:hypothetical protein
MKKLLFLLFVLALFACEKEPVFCWKCRRDVLVPGATYSVMLKVCDVSENGIKEFEKDNTYIKGTTTLSMTCWKE